MSQGYCCDRCQNPQAGVPVMEIRAATHVSVNTCVKRELAGFPSLIQLCLQCAEDAAGFLRGCSNRDDIDEEHS
jgi:hypothetical protein